MPKKSKPAKRQPFYQSPPPKPATKVHSLQSTVKSPKPDTHPSTGDRGHETLDIPHAHPVPPAHFELREDGSISPTVDSGHRTADSTPPRLVYHDEARKVWLYHGNCLELLDAIAAKYPDGRFDAIFADPPYFLSNGGITCHAGELHLKRFQRALTA